MSELYLVDFCKPDGAAPERIECGLGVSRQACAAQPPSDSSVAKAFSSQTCMAQPPSVSGGGLGFDLGLCSAAPSDSSAAEAFSSETCVAQPPSASGGGLGFDLDLYSAAPEWFGWRPRIFGWNLCGAAPRVRRVAA